MDWLIVQKLTYWRSRQPVMVDILRPAGPALAGALHVDYPIITNMCKCYNFDAGGPEKSLINFVWPKFCIPLQLLNAFSLFLCLYGVLTCQFIFQRT